MQQPRTAIFKKQEGDCFQPPSLVYSVSVRDLPDSSACRQQERPGSPGIPSQNSASCQSICSSNDTTIYIAEEFYSLMKQYKLKMIF